MYLFFDTETTGLKDSPRIVQIGWSLTDQNGNELRTQCFIVRPDGFDIPLGATRIHGITTEVARRSGIEITAALEAFAKDIPQAELCVAHNISFDTDIIAGEFRRLGRDESPLSAKTLYCTMRSTTDFCKIQQPGRSTYKWPSLVELHTVLFGESYEPAHNALADAQACARCFFELKRRGVIPTEQPIARRQRVVDWGDEEEQEEQRSEDEELIEEIELYADNIRDYEEVWVNRFSTQLQRRGFLTQKQREILRDILSRLEERS